MPTKPELVALLHEARSELRAALDAVDPAREVSPGWSVRDVLAHLNGWEAATVEALRALLRGDVYSLEGYRGIDAFNEEMVAARAAMTFAALRQECESLRGDLLAVFAEVPEAELETAINAPWGRQTVERMVAVIGYHEQDHAREIAALA